MQISKHVPHHTVYQYSILWLLCMEGRLPKYGIHQPLFDDMERKFINLKLHHELPLTEAIDELTSERQHALIVMDD